MAPLSAPGLRPARSFERLYRKHAADVYRYALAVLRDPADAEDVTQTTFLNAYRAMERGDRPQSPRSWLLAIAHNVCRQRFRQAQRRPAEVAFDETTAEALVHDDDAPSADDITRALGKLAFNQRAALVMRELEGRSYAEIAETLELSVSAVETLLFRARRALREQLEGGLTCGEAERAVSRQLDGRLPRAERGPLRAHLRECESCASLARRMRAQRSAVRALGMVPLPASLASLFGGGAAAGGGAIAVKAAAVVAVAAVVGGAGHQVVVAREPAPPTAAPRAADVVAAPPAEPPVALPAARIAVPAARAVPPSRPESAALVRAELPQAAKAAKAEKVAKAAEAAQAEKAAKAAAPKAAPPRATPVRAQPARPADPPKATPPAARARPATPAKPRAKAAATPAVPAQPATPAKPVRPVKPKPPEPPAGGRRNGG